MALGKVFHHANRYAARLFPLGLLAVAAYNWRQWQRDKARLSELGQPEPAPDWRDWPELPMVSVLVAAWNEAEMIELHIEAFLELSYPNKELILCAGGDDETYEIARLQTRERVAVLEQRAGEGKQGALQRCLSHATGDILFLTDADCLLDDDSFLRTLAPLVVEQEAVATGQSRPLSQQMNSPLIVHQWSTDLYAGSRHGRYVSGILGRNCALRRSVLDRIHGFQASVRTGTDYHMAKLLLQHGYRIRYISDSEPQTRYPDSVRSYWQRQSRWVRNLIIHGPAFGAYDEVRQAFRTSLVGLAMLTLPGLAHLLGPTAFVVWALMFSQSLAAKFRHADFARQHRGLKITIEQILFAPLHVLLDCVAWSRPLVDLIWHRTQW